MYLKRIHERAEADYLKRTLAEVLDAHGDDDDGIHQCYLHDQPDLLHSRNIDFHNPDEDSMSQVTAASKPLETLPEHEEDVKFITNEVAKKLKPINDRIKVALIAMPQLKKKLFNREEWLKKIEQRPDAETKKESIDEAKKEIEDLKKKITELKPMDKEGLALIKKYDAHVADRKELKQLRLTAGKDEKVDDDAVMINRQQLMQDIMDPIAKEFPDKFHARLTSGNLKLANEGITPFSLPEVATCPGAGDCKNVCYAKFGQMAFPMAVIKRWVNYYATKTPHFISDMKTLLGSLKGSKQVTVKDLDTAIAHVRTEGRDIIEKLTPKQYQKRLADQQAKIDQVKSELKTSLTKDLAKEEADKKKFTSRLRIKELTKELADIKDSFKDVHPNKLIHGKEVQYDWDAVRIHDAGDFYDAEYVRKWIEIVQAHPELKFYAYTKTYGLTDKKLVAALNDLEKEPNFKLIQSAGSIGDKKMDLKKAKAVIFPTIEALEKAGFQHASKSDRVAIDPSTNEVGLVIHGAGKGYFDYPKHIKDLPKELRDRLKAAGIEEIEVKKPVTDWKKANAPKEKEKAG